MWSTLPMQGRGSSTHCVSVCLCVYVCYHFNGRYECFIRYQQKTLNVGKKINMGIELNKPFDSYDSY